MQCQAMKWADEYSDMVDAAEAAYDEADAFLNRHLDIAQDIAAMLAEEEHGEACEDWTKEQWEQFARDNWESIVDIYMDKL